MRFLAGLAEAGAVTEAAAQEEGSGKKTLRAVCFEGGVLEEGEEGPREAEYGGV